MSDPQAPPDKPRPRRAEPVQPDRLLGVGDSDDAPDSNREDSPHISKEVQDRAARTQEPLDAALKRGGYKKD